MMRLDRLLRPAALAAVAALGLGLAACEKDEAFFTLVGHDEGSVEVVVDGTPAGASVRITGEGVDETQVVGDVPHVFAGLPYGSYQVAITPPQGYLCVPTTQTVVINAQDPDGLAEFGCNAIVAPGTFRLTTQGLAGNVFLNAELDGPVNRSGQLGSAGLEWSDLPAGNYLWGIEQTVGWNCLPAFGTFTLGGGQTVTAALTCTETEGGLSVTVTGATALVNYTGPESGSANVGATPTIFGALTPGQYTLSITNPTGFTCLPASQQATVTAGTTTGVAFACTANALPTSLSLDLSTVPNTGGAVAAGVYPLNLRDDANAIRASLNLYTIGTQTFWGSGPFRLGAGFSSGYGINYSATQVDGQAYGVNRIDFCILNATLDGAHPVTINHRTAGGTLLGSTAITTSPFCGNTMPPVGTVRTEWIAPTDRFFDFNMVRIYRP